jgi:hypothetical protein
MNGDFLGDGFSVIEKAIDGSADKYYAVLLAKGVFFFLSFLIPPSK